MLLEITAEEALARSRQIEVNGRQYTIAEYVGAAPRRGIYVDGNEVNDNGLPQGFLVIQPAGAITPAHFHEPNQFQVFVDGDARIGAHTARPLTVQYANGHTPYGPIVASDAGVNYFTLRQRWDPGAKYLPASRDKLVKGRQRARIKSEIAFAERDTQPPRTGVETAVVFAREPDGLAGWHYRLAAGVECQLEDPADGGGQYVVVTRGELSAAGRLLGRNSLVFVSPKERTFRAVAGAQGVEFLLLQFPRIEAAG